MSAAWSNAALVHLPIHASWLNQVVRDLLLDPATHDDHPALAERILAFGYNTTASPFDWTYTTTGLNAYLVRLNTHEQRAA